MDALAFTGTTPTIDIEEIAVPTVGSITVTGLSEEPALSSPVEAPSIGSITITGLEPTTDP